MTGVIPAPEHPASWPPSVRKHMLRGGGILLKPVELEIELFCRGLRIDPSCEVNTDGRRISRTRAGLGSGLEIVLPSPRKKIWVNVPVVEAFAAKSPFLLMKTSRGKRRLCGERLD